eukprot:1159255-Pelagomonas_calceolata.AAC.11
MRTRSQRETPVSTEMGIRSHERIDSPCRCSQTCEHQHGNEEPMGEKLWVGTQGQRQPPEQNL